MKPNITALKQLRRVVENAPDDLLHMGAWQEKSSCGTARCAAGWATVDPWFIERGLKPDDSYPAPRFKDLWGSAALRIFFRLSGEQTRDLFGTGMPESLLDDPHSVSKRQVLNQIDRILHGEPTRPYRRSLAKRPV